jgi:hypothetical protein
VDKSKLGAGSFTLNDILEELREPGRDPRETFVAAAFQEGVNEIGDLVPEMQLEGVVTNVRVRCLRIKLRSGRRAGRSSLLRCRQCGRMWAESGVLHRSFLGRGEADCG